MNDDHRVMTLDYEMTYDQMRELFERYGHTIRYRFHQAALMLTAASAIWFAIDAWQDGDHWTACVLGFAGLFLATSRWLLFRVIPWYCGRMYPPLALRLEIDDGSLLYCAEGQTYGHRYWWSRMSRCEEANSWIECHFDGDEMPSLVIPVSAFDDDRRRRFDDLVDRYVTVTAESAIGDAVA